MNEIKTHNPTEFCCPHCKSDNIQKVSLAYAHGTKATASSTFGVLGGAIGFGSTSGIEQSVAAGNLEPPQSGNPILFLVLLLIAAICFFAGSIPWMIAFLVGATIVGVKLHKQNKAYPDAIASWQKLYVCQRCATIFNLT